MWYIGQRVVAITNSAVWKKGQEFTVMGIMQCCCYTGLNIGIHTGGTRCSKCKTDAGGDWFDAIHFRPIQSFGEEVAERISNEIKQEEEIAV